MARHTLPGWIGVSSFCPAEESHKSSELSVAGAHECLAAAFLTSEADPAANGSAFLYGKACRGDVTNKLTVLPNFYTTGRLYRAILPAEYDKILNMELSINLGIWTDNEPTARQANDAVDLFRPRKVLPCR